MILREFQNFLKDWKGMSSLGKKGEDLASEYLRKKGYKVKARNYKTRLGEIDIIAEKDNVIVFVEVKTRSNNSFGCPFEAVHQKKRQKLKNVALLYLKRYKRHYPVQFDVLSITLMGNNNPVIEHITNAFEC
jgi:putative endonuclease